MLFNSYSFLFSFLPVTLALFHLLRRRSWVAALAAVAVLSLVFYATWDPRYLALLVPSLVINYWLGELIARTRRRLWLWIGVAANLAVIAWFKYSLFLYVNLSGADAPDFLRDIALPLGISFITFQKIAYLVDVWRGHPKASSFGRFAFFVLFFPQLIAGPIVLFRNLDRQVGHGPRSNAWYRSAVLNGVLLFSIGLFKKVVFADALGYFADELFAYAGNTLPLRSSDAWLAALSYSLQLYFDFSAYSDMAIGLAWMFGFRLPVNFNSPYQATSIIDFWRRWHMTLSAFFREYVYIPLGGNRRGVARQAMFVAIVFLLTGLWHGAGWTFVAWGGLHGVLVLINHLWSKYSPMRLPVVVARAATVVVVIALWVIFRAPSWTVAGKILRAMVVAAPAATTRALANDVFLYVPAAALVGVLGVTAVVMPNSRRITRALRRGHFAVAGNRRAPAPRPWLAAAVVGVVLYVAVASIGSMHAKFIYFNF